MSWANPEDIEARWLLEGEIPATDTQLAALIADAEDTITARVPDVQARINSGVLPLSRVVKITAALVIERLKNPRGTRQLNSTTGPFTDSETFGGDNPGAMTLSDEQVRELTGGAKRAAFTVNTVPAGWSGGVGHG